MKERPILFSAPMIRLILDGRKAQTRRVLRFPPHRAAGNYEWVKSVCADGGGNWVAWSIDEPYLGEFTKRAYPRGEGFPCPYGKPGDRLWVRETWGAVWPDVDPVPLEQCRIEYRADLPDGCTDYPGQWPDEYARGSGDAPKWRSPFHMPRWAARLVLDVKVVRAERLQDITVRDAIEETGALPALFSRLDPREYFAHMWDGINGKRAPWASNPWVWVIEFSRTSS